MPDVVKAAENAFSDADTYPVDSRGLAYSYAFVGIKRLHDRDKSGGRRDANSHEAR